MNKKIYLIGSLIVAAVIAGVGLNELRKSNLGSYEENALGLFASNGKEAKGADEALEWLKARYVDVQTGQQVSDAKLLEIRKRVAQMDRSKNITFTEEGPDNIGGRTRAIHE